MGPYGALWDPMGPMGPMEPWDPAGPEWLAAHWARDPGPNPKKSARGPGPALFFGPGPGSRAPCCRHLPMSLARAHDMGLGSSGKGILLWRQHKFILALNQVPVGAPDNSKGRSASFFAANLMGPFSERPNPYFCCFTTEARPYLIGRCHMAW